MIIHCRKCKREFDNHSRRNQHEKDAHDYKAGSHPVNRGTIGNITDGKTVRIARAILAEAAPKQSVPDGPSECRHCGFMVKLNETPISSSDMNVEANVALLRDRAAVGFKKYGVTTERADLSQEDWIQHTIEELLDAANYLQAMRNNPAKGK